MACPARWIGGHSGAAFDLLYLNGYDLRKLPLFEREELLRKLIADTAICSALTPKFRIARLAVP